jgi:hypothetical protein
MHFFCKKNPTVDCKRRPSSPAYKAKAETVRFNNDQAQTRGSHASDPMKDGRKAKLSVRRPIITEPLDASFLNFSLLISFGSRPGPKLPCESFLRLTTSKNRLNL